MVEKVHGVEMLFIRNTGGNDYSLEFVGQHRAQVTLNFSDVESVELNPKEPVEIKHSFAQLAEKAPKAWNLRFAHPHDVRVVYSGKIVIEFV